MQNSIHNIFEDDVRKRNKVNYIDFYRELQSALDEAYANAIWQDNRGD